MYVGISHDFLKRISPGVLNNAINMGIEMRCTPRSHVALLAIALIGLGHSPEFIAKIVVASEKTIAYSNLNC